jgi:hypothetical protein
MRALEDKTAIDTLWARAGLVAAPHRVVPVTGNAMRNAAAELDQGDGVVISGDERSGPHGGALLVRWVVGEPSERVINQFSRYCDRVRIMPFLEGIPCSIGGFVLADRVVVLRPCELLTLRTERGFLYCGVSTWWDPASDTRSQMREVARRVGVLIREELGYRGAFTIDGIGTAEGFVPTELNARVGQSHMISGVPAIPPILFDAFLLAEQGWVAPEGLEAGLLGAADGVRRDEVRALFDRACPRPRVLHMRFADGGPVVCGADRAHVEVNWAPWRCGSVVRVRLNPGVVLAGTALGPSVAGLMATASTIWGLGLGRVSSARELRAG